MAGGVRHGPFGKNPYSERTVVMREIQGHPLPGAGPRRPHYGAGYLPEEIGFVPVGIVYRK